ncbi:MAG: translation initiation factor eIF-2B [Bacteroidetes bacterium]|nr:translation initiation factor eIF-2B [Bacteroidota bacterium]
MAIIGDASLKKILSDKTSGSGELLLKLNNYLSKKQKNVHGIQRLIPTLKKHFQSFENIQKYLLELNKLIRTGKLSSKFFLNSDKETRSNNKKFVNALPYFKRHKIVLTISNSRTVLELLKRIRKEKRNLEVIVCESRPKLEGRIMASALAKAGIKVLLITESMMGEYVQKSDAVLIGADTVLKNGDVVNKVGSKTLAILCKEFKKPFFVAADKSKFSMKNKFVQREEDGKEIWHGAPKNIALRNRYFEIIQKSYITKIFTD